MLAWLAILPLSLATLLLPLAAAGQAQTAKTLRVGIVGDENNLSPFTVTFQSGRAFDLVNLVYDTLFWSPNEPEPKPMLATSYSVSGDGLTWTVTLRDGVTWHDGVPLTSADVRFTYEYFLKHDAGRFSHHLKQIIDSVETPDPRTAVFRLKFPSSTFLQLPLADQVIVPKHIWEKVEAPLQPSRDLVVGSGPYRVVEYRPDQSYRLQANAGYFFGEAAVKELILPIVKDRTALFGSLRTGELDAVAVPLPAELVGQFGAGSDIAVARGTDYLTPTLYFNHRRAPGNAPQFRQAVSFAIDRDEIVRTLLLGLAAPGRPGWVHPKVRWTEPKLVSARDTAKAKALLDGLGLADRDGDGTRERPDGTKLELQLFVNALDPVQVRLGELVRGMLATAGLSLKVVPLDPVTLRARGAGLAPAVLPDWDLIVFDWPAHIQTDPDGLRWLLRSGLPFTSLKLGYVNRELDRLLDEAQRATSGGSRDELLRRAQALVAEDVPLMALYHAEGAYAYRPAAYNGWTYVSGESILNKRSFLEKAPAPAAAEGTAAAAPSALLVGLALLGLAGLMTLALWLARRKGSRKKGRL